MGRPKKQNREPFWRSDRSCYYVQDGTRQVRLSPDKDEAWRLWHEFMARPPEQREAAPPSGPDAQAVAILDAFLDWCQKHKAGRTYDWYLGYLESFARSLPVRPDHGPDQAVPRPAVDRRQPDLEDRQARGHHRRPAGVQLGRPHGPHRGEPRPHAGEAQGGAARARHLRRAVRDHHLAGARRGIPRPADGLLGDRVPPAGGALRRGVARQRGRGMLGVPGGRIEGQGAPAGRLPDRQGPGDHETPDGHPSRAGRSSSTRTACPGRPRRSTAASPG